MPHPILAQSYARELLKSEVIPRSIEVIPAACWREPWDSSNLYWARLADEKGYSPVMLNVLVPQLTHRMVENIFASDLEDWPAMLRAMRETGRRISAGEDCLGCVILLFCASWHGRRGAWSLNKGILLKKYILW